MRRMITLLVSVTIVIASATLVVFLLFLPESDAVRRYAEKRFSETTDLNVTIKSSPDILFVSFKCFRPTRSSGSD